MTIVKYRLEKDGTLAPPTVEFEPGDAIKFESDKPVYVLLSSSVALQALHSFALDEISAEIKDGAIWLCPPNQPKHTSRDLDPRVGTAGGNI